MIGHGLRNDLVDDRSLERFRPVKCGVRTEMFVHVLEVGESGILHQVDRLDGMEEADEAVEFFTETPTYRLPLTDSFGGAGVYALYYAGDFDLYARIASLKQEDLRQPNYVGKAVPPGWRTARSQGTDAPVLYQRLREHSKNIQATSLQVDDFYCRFVILGGVESDLIVPLEARLIRTYDPLWNTVVDGFGNHDPGRGRYNQAKSEWDVLHPGRTWAERLDGESPNLVEIVAQVQRFLSGVS